MNRNFDSDRNLAKIYQYLKKEKKAPGRIGLSLRQVFGGIFKYAVLLFVITTTVLPLLWIVISSFKTNMEVLDSAFTFPKTFSFDSYVTVAKVAKIFLYFSNSAIVSFFSVVFALTVFGMAGYVLARFDFKGKNLIYLLFGTTLLIPQNSMMTPIYLLTKYLHIYDTKIALILVYTAIGLPLSIFILRSYFVTIPQELEESAYMEGASFLKTYCHIILPLSKPALASAGALLFLNYWNEFLFALLLTSSQNNRTLPLALSYFLGQFTYDYPSLFAAIVISVIPSIIIYFLIQERITNSMAGALKE
ncbi:MAG: carbohydrate ABC transporter permease [Bacillota bacterium]